jgi:surface carbohydrate biosynthesis protein
LGLKDLLVKIAFASKTMFGIKRLHFSPNQSDIFIYSDFAGDIFRNLFSGKTVFILDLKLTAIYLLPALRAFKKMLLGKSLGHGPVFQYTVEVITIVKPRVMLTFMDESLEFYRLKPIFPDANSIIVQNGRRFVPGDIFGREVAGPVAVDFIFSFSDAVGRLYQSFLGGSVQAHGSLKLNQFMLTNPDSSPNKDNKILYISGYEPENQYPVRWVKGSPIPYNRYFNADEILVRAALEFSEEKGAIFQIAGRSNSSDPGELAWFESVLGQQGSRWEFIPKTSQLSTYSLANQAKLIVTCDSTMGYELLAAGARVFFNSCRGHFVEDESYGFGWPERFPEAGPIWNSSVNRSEIKSSMDDLYSMSSRQYSQTATGLAPKVMSLDVGNQRLRRLVMDLVG